MPSESGAESTGRPIANTLGNLGDAALLPAKQVLGQCHAPGDEVFHGRHSDRAVESLEESGARERGPLGQRRDAPRPGKLLVHGTDRTGETLVGDPARGLRKRWYPYSIARLLRQNPLPGDRRHLLWECGRSGLARSDRSVVSDEDPGRRRRRPMGSRGRVIRRRTCPTGSCRRQAAGAR